MHRRAGKVLCKGKVKAVLAAVREARSSADVAETGEAGRTVSERERASVASSETLYVRHLTLRTVPADDFLAGLSHEYGFALPITSIGEERLGQEMGLAAPRAEALDEGSVSRGMAGSVHALQRKTAEQLLRVYPLGLRFAGKNLDPLVCWRAGAQHVALNLGQHPDLAAQLHYALFEDTGGYVRKPEEMVDGRGWPPRRESLRRVTIELLSLHGLPKQGEERPSRDGAHGASHGYVPELTGSWRAPAAVESSSTLRLKVSLHAIGGFCSVSTRRQPRQVETEHVTSSAGEHGGLSPRFGETVHLLAAEPHETILRVAVLESDEENASVDAEEVAFDTVVLGRMRPGYRTLHLRSRRGTRIEMCHLFVHISHGNEPHKWPSASELREEVETRRSEAADLRKEISQLRRGGVWRQGSFDVGI